MELRIVLDYWLGSIKWGWDLRFEGRRKGDWMPLLKSSKKASVGNKQAFREWRGEGGWGKVRLMDSLRLVHWIRNPIQNIPKQAFVSSWYTFISILVQQWRKHIQQVFFWEFGEALPRVNIWQTLKRRSLGRLCRIGKTYNESHNWYWSGFIWNNYEYTGNFLPKYIYACSNWMAISIHGMG